MLTEDGTVSSGAPDNPGAFAPATAPLGTGWTIATIAIGVFAALIGLDGMVLSFRAVSAEMVPQFGKWALGVPLGVDLAVFAFSGVDLLLARLDMRHPLPRAIVYAATAATIALNASAGGSLAGLLAHVAMPLLWVGFAEVLRHIVRTRVGLATGTLREPIPAARWILSPWPTAKLWRRMVLWRVNSYTVALAHERARLRQTAALREKHGVLWRLYVTPLVRLELSLGPTETAGVPSAAPTTDRAEAPPTLAADTANPAPSAVADSTPPAIPSAPVSAPTRRSQSAPNAAAGDGRDAGTVTDIGAARRRFDEWTALAEPLYRRHLNESGEHPSGPQLAALLARAGHGKLGASRARDVRVAVEKIVKGDGAGETEPERERWAV